jgi:8-oxo-dGTP pyrophosphatase MutT (NUDIX family)
VVSFSEVTFEDPAANAFVRDVVRHPGAVMVVPVLAGGSEVLMVRQYRVSIDRELLEIPAGRRDVEGEPPEATAHRELAEEVGMTARRMEPLAEVFSSPGYSDEYSYLYMARDMQPCHTWADGPEEQHMTVERVAFADLDRLIATAELVDAKSIIGLCLARDALAREGAGDVAGGPPS